MLFKNNLCNGYIRPLLSKFTSVQDLETIIGLI